MGCSCTNITQRRDCLQCDTRRHSRNLRSSQRDNDLGEGDTLSLSLRVIKTYQHRELLTYNLNNL